MTKENIICCFCKIRKGDTINSRSGDRKYYVCNRCNTERARRYRKTKKGMENVRNSVYRSIKKYPYKQKARYILRDNILSGKVIKPKKCISCGKVKKLEGHHIDYDKPLEVLWLCRSCHCKLHKS